MEIEEIEKKPHLIFVPYPTQGHINPLLQLAKLLHFRGFFITFVNTEFNHHRLLKARGPDSVKGLPDFRFETIPDGLPNLDHDRTQDVPELCQSISNNCHTPFLNLLKKLNTTPGAPPVTCIIADGVMSFSLQAAEEMGIPEFVFFTLGASGFTGFLHYAELIEKGYVPLKDESCLTNGYLDTPIDWIPGMKGIRLKDITTFIRTTNSDDIMLNYDLENCRNAAKAKGVIINTFEELEHDVLDGIRSKFSLPMIPIGPLVTVHRQISPDSPSYLIGSSLWIEDSACLEWLDSRKPRSVLYVNFGSIAVLTPQQMIELAWGLANSKHPFLWIIRPDLVSGESAVSPESFLEETKGRCMLASWCPQVKVLEHQSIGGYLTHCGWNSTIESISLSGVAMLCYPFFSDQTTNCFVACGDWGIGMEINPASKRDEIEGLVRELMEGERGKKMRKKAMEWKESAARAVTEGGSSHVNLEKLIEEMLYYH